MKRRSQTGSLLALVMLGLAAVAVLATIAYGSYYQIARGTQDTITRAQSAALLTQAAYTLVTEAAAVGDIDSDGITEPAAGSTVLGDGFDVPATSGAPKTDAWGSNFLYCPWDNGSTNASAGRLSGINTSDQNNLQFALVSAGPDKVFSTTCATLLAQSVARTPAVAGGDDGVRSMSVAQVKQGVGGTYYYGDPVPSVVYLPSGTRPGELRIALDTQIPYVWNGYGWFPLPSGAWLVISPYTDCSLYPPGTLARDGADDLYLCAGNGRFWKRVQWVP